MATIPTKERFFLNFNISRGMNVPKLDQLTDACWLMPTISSSSVAASVPTEPEPQWQPDFVSEPDFEPESLTQLSERTASCLPLDATPSEAPPKKQKLSGPFCWVGVSTRTRSHKAAEPTPVQARSTVRRRGKSTRQPDFEYNLTQAMK